MTDRARAARPQLKSPSVKRILQVVLLVAVGGGSAVPATAQRSPRARARELGIPLNGTPGQSNAITDVPGVEVGHATLIEGAGQRQVGKGPVRTGVTVGYHVTREHVFAAIDGASGGPIAEGNVGGGTGTTRYRFERGTSTVGGIPPRHVPPHPIVSVPAVGS